MNNFQPLFNTQPATSIAERPCVLQQLMIYRDSCGTSFEMKKKKNKCCKNFKEGKRCKKCPND